MTVLVNQQADWKLTQMILIQTVIVCINNTSSWLLNIKDIISSEINKGD